MEYPRVDVPTFDKLMWPLLKTLKAMGGSASNEELLAKVIELEGYSPEVQSFQHIDNRQSKLNYNLAWAKSYLGKAGALENSSRGVWSITKFGEDLTLREIPAIPSQVRRKLLDEKMARQDEKMARQTANIEDIPASTASVEELEVVEPSWKDQLLVAVRGIPPAAFERLAQRLLREAGFLRVEVTGRSGDGGIDGIGVLRINLLSFQVLFQCKRYQGSVGSNAIRDFRGAMVGRSDKGLMITTGTFTAEAKREATRDGAPAIDLIDGDQLCDLLKQLKLGVKTELVEKMTVEAVWFESL